MYTRCTTEKSAAQQALLEKTLLQTMAQQPYSEISVSFLCEEAGLSRKTFYRLFNNKDDVLTALIDHTLIRYMAYHPNERDALGSLDELHLFFEFWREEQPLLDALQNNHLSSLLLERSVWYCMNQEPGILRHFSASITGAHQEILLFYVSGIMSLLISWHRSGFRKSSAEMAGIMRSLMVTAPVKT